MLGQAIGAKDDLDGVFKFLACCEVGFQNILADNAVESLNIAMLCGLYRTVRKCSTPWLVRKVAK